MERRWVDRRRIGKGLGWENVEGGEYGRGSGEVEVERTGLKRELGKRIWAGRLQHCSLRTHICTQRAN